MSDVLMHVIVTGHVQGVGYREFVRREALDRNISGWVRNLRDGSVEALLAGPQDLLDDMFASLRQGPPAARVADVQARQSQGHGDSAARGASFKIKPTEG